VSSRYFARERQTPRLGHIVGLPIRCNIGCAQHHLASRRTISLRRRRSGGHLRLGDSLSRHGFERIYFLTGHGSTSPPCEARLFQDYIQILMRPKVCHSCSAEELVAFAGNRTSLRTSIYEGHGSTPLRRKLPSPRGLPDSIKKTVVRRPTSQHGPIRDALDYRRRFPMATRPPPSARARKGARMIAKCR